ncbi:hypothetical protein QBC46DRAFT_441361 [Diplogelasinospora grovesii]|uniref:Zn(2)-C6 fungal-type domain-containing protein n=1 Tax=Diplogelasinospora grovesii TaxID=303347 RepID=A0AAN6S2M0_9PEZI|nr:hypothetical protein QBC46DRAFT_441361 [Diplogelasinospora grovesii]
MDLDYDTSSPQASTGASTAKPRPKRTRTGCLKCRTRRRKCDEGKPQCQRCIDGDFECQYPSGLTFLEKNALDITRFRGPLDETSGRVYPRLQFAEPGASSSREKRVPIAPPTETINRGRTHSASRPPRGEEPREDANPALHLPADSLERQSEQSVWTPMGDGPLSPVGLPSASEPFPVLGPRAVPSNDYETALQVLVSLGNGTGTDNAVASTASPLSQYSRQGLIPSGVNRSPAQRQSFSGTAVRADMQENGARAGAVAGDVTQSAMDLLHLTRNYRYEVAPWANICDMDQSFGMAVLCAAMESRPVLEPLLALSATSLGLQSGMAKPGEPSGHFLESRHTRRSEVESLLVGALSAAQAFIITPPSSWHGLPAGFNLGAMDDQSSLAGLGVKNYALCLLLRLDLAAALVSGTSVSSPNELLFQALPSRNYHTIAGGIFRYAFRSLQLCGRAVNFCSGDPPPPPPPPSSSSSGPAPQLSRAQTWQLVVDELRTWYAERPQSFQPMVELDVEPNPHPSNQALLFPKILFTNGAALLANQLHHTAMMLLLKNKPRTLSLQPRRSPALSALWHARRICGIALHNDRRECWDPSLVASLYVTAQGMTYEPQQREILRLFKRIGDLTGWHLPAECFAAELCRGWEMAGVTA